MTWALWFSWFNRSGSWLALVKPKGLRFSFSISSCRSAQIKIKSVCLGSLLFNLRMLPVGAIIKNHNIAYHSLSAGRQLYLSFYDNLTPALVVLFAEYLKVFRTEQRQDSEQVRNLYIILDSDLRFDNHIDKISRSAFYQWKNITKLKKTEKLVLLPCRAGQITVNIYLQNSPDHH